MLLLLQMGWNTYCFENDGIYVEQSNASILINLLLKEFARIAYLI